MAEDDENIEKAKITLKGLSDEIKKAFTFSLDDFINDILAVDKSAREVAKSFGQGSEFLQSIKESMADAVSDVTRLGGDWNKVVGMQKEYSTALGRSVVLSSDLYKDLYATTEVLDVSLKDVTTSFRDAGANTRQAIDGMQEVVNVTRRSGVNAHLVSEQVLENMSKMNRFTFQGGVEGLAKMAAQAVSLRVNMKSTLDLSERLFDPEKAIDMAASMQRLGVAQSDLLDPLRLMDLAQNDPTELQNQIVKMSEQFVQLNAKGQFEIMPGARRQLMEIAKAMDMNYEDITKMALGSADLDRKMKEIKFPTDAVSEEQRQMIANMAEVGKNGKYEVTFTTQNKDTGELMKVTKSIEDLTKQDIEALDKAGEKKSLEQLQQESLDVNTFAYQELQAIREGILKGTSTSRVAGSLVGGIRGGVETISKTARVPEISTPKIREITDQTIGNLVNKLADLTEGKISFNSFAKSMGETEQKVTEFGNSLGNNIFKNLKEASEDLKNSTNPLFRMVKGITEGALKNELGIKPTSTTTQTNAKDFIIPLEQDQLRIYDNALVGGTNLGGNQSNQTSNSEIKVDFNLKIDSNNPNIDTNQLMVIMEKQEFKQKMVESLKDAYTNGKVGQIGGMVSV